MTWRCTERWLLIVALAAAVVADASAAKWQKLTGCRIATGEYMDGDSFHVRHGNKEYIFRLYFVDAPESDREIADRITEQAAYWDIPEMRVTRLGRKAKSLTEKTLRSDFTVYTQWEDAQGASQMQRFYAVVKIGHDDLAELLVGEGLARIYGATTPLPDGTSIDTYFQRLHQLEARAKRKKLGAWSGAEVEAEPEETDVVAEAAVEEPPPAVSWPNVPVVAFLRAEAFINTERFEEAEEEMRALLRRFPDHNQKARIEFYLGLSIAMQERFPEAIQIFRDWLAKNPDHIMVPEVKYWLPIALFYGGEYADAIPLFEDYAAKYPMSVYAPEAGYRAALSRYAIEDYARAAQDLEAWVVNNPGHYFQWEALVTLGDALAAMGELDRAKGAYLRVGKEAGPFYYMALTQAAKVFKALGTPRDMQDMAAAFAKFIQDSPQSDNIIDAAYQAGWALRHIQRQDDARKLYWTMIERYGNTPAWEGFDLMLKDLTGMYGDAAADGFLSDLRAKQQKALAERRTTLASRLAWVEAESKPEEEQLANAVVFAARYPRDELGTETLAWLGELHFRNGKTAEGMACLEQLLKVNPESRYAALAHTRIAELKVAAKSYEEALTHTELAVAYAAAPAVIMEATFLRAKSLEGLQRYSEAVTDYNTVLSGRSAPRPLKPEALLGIGACLEAQGRYRHAIPYYQRIYVLYGAYTSAVARAYLRSGMAFEQLKDVDAAAKTYHEMLEQDTLSGTAEATEARQRLLKLGSG